MTTTHERNDRDVDRVAEDLLTELDGLELLGRAVDVILDRAVASDDTLRESIEEAILHGDPRPTGPDGAIQYYASVATVAAFTVLRETDDDDLKDPVQAWIRRCPKLTALYRSDLGPGVRTNVSFYGCEILLPFRLRGVSARLVTGDSDDYAQLIVSKRLAVTIGLVHCPITIRQALNVVEDC